MTPASDAPAPRVQVSRQQITDGFLQLGVRAGDILYLRCGLSRLGVRPSDIEDVFLGGILDALGPEGTLITPAFGKTSLRWEKPLAVSAPDSVPTTGAFAKLVLARPDAYRSTHPTHSFVGLGRQAEEILRNHPDEGACFEPIRSIVEADGIMALVGCVESSPGFSTVHLAQYDLGLSQRHYTKLMLAVRKTDSEGPIFRPVESPGCSSNFGVFYKDYIEDRNLRSGYVGKAWSVAVRAKAAYTRERAILERNPRYTVCEQEDCLSCRITRGYNKRAIPGALLHRAKRMMFGAARPD
jgi:aminoglycoside N3'-acetyltransferase